MKCPHKGTWIDDSRVTNYLMCPDTENVDHELITSRESYGLKLYIKAERFIYFSTKMVINGFSTMIQSQKNSVIASSSQVTPTKKELRILDPDSCAFYARVHQKKM